MWSAVKTCWWYDEPHAHYLFHSVFKGENPYVILFVLFFLSYHWLVFRSLLTDFFQTWYDDRDYYAVHFDSRLHDFDLDSRSHL